MRLTFGLLFRLFLALTIWIVGIPLSIHLNLDSLVLRTLYGISWGLVTVAVVIPHFFLAELKKGWRVIFPGPKEELLALAEELRVEARAKTKTADLLEKEAASLDKKTEEQTVERSA